MAGASGKCPHTSWSCWVGGQGTALRSLQMLECLRPRRHGGYRGTRLRSPLASHFLIPVSLSWNFLNVVAPGPCPGVWQTVWSACQAPGAEPDRNKEDRGSSRRAGGGLTCALGTTELSLSCSVALKPRPWEALRAATVCCRDLAVAQCWYLCLGSQTCCRLGLDRQVWVLEAEGRCQPGPREPPTGPYC